MQNDGTGPIGLVGGDEFRGPAEAFDRLLLSLAPRSPASVAILPTAAAGENPHLAAAHGVKHFERLGARSYSVLIVDGESANNARLVDELRGADLIYFSGGSPAHLLESMEGSAAWRCLAELSQQGAILAGSSAGAMVLCERLMYRGQDVAGLALVRGVVVLPHFERSSAGRIEELRSSLPSGLTLLGIAGATGCVLHDGRWRVQGPGQVTVMTKTAADVYSAGDSFSLP